MTTRRSKLVVVGFLAIVVAASLASAAVAGPCGCDYGYGWRSVYYTQELSNVPYYALYPPVYYSAAVPRTYGYSPFAYPPGTMTPDAAPEGPKTIENPYVPQKSKDAEQPKPKPSSDKTAAAPKIIINPFVNTARLTAAGKPAR